MLNTIADLLPSTYTHNILCMYLVHGVMDANPNVKRCVSKKRKRERERAKRSTRTHRPYPTVLIHPMSWCWCGLTLFSHSLCLMYTKKAQADTRTHKHAISDHLLEWARARARAPTKKTIPNKKNYNSKRTNEWMNETELKHAHLKNRSCAVCYAVQWKWIYMYVSETISAKPNRTEWTNQPSKKDGKEMK